jgi:hypothetical protein
MILSVTVFVVNIKGRQYIEDLILNITLFLFEDLGEWGI